MKKNMGLYVALGCALGAGVGAAVGSSSGNMEQSLAIGIAIGIAIGCAVGAWGVRKCIHGDFIMILRMISSSKTETSSRFKWK